MRLYRSVAVLVMVVAGACASGRPATDGRVEARGVASWYGQEFAGRTTANGEIFDPSRLTAAHRTLPFGTVVEVRNLANDRRVEVRINDRGPFIGGRIIDLSYAAARAIDLVDAGVGEVEIRILRTGAGDLEPPQPIVVSANAPPTVEATPPAVEFPLPGEVRNSARPEPRREPAPTRQADDAVVDRITVEEIRDGTPVRRQVSSDGSRIEEVPMDDGRGIQAPSPAANRPSTRPAAPAAIRSGFDLQLGAFGSEANASTLAADVRVHEPRVRVESFRDLYRVRVGPYPTREAAIDAQERLATAGFESIVVPAS